MARGKIQVLVSVNEAPVWRLILPLDSRFIRHLSPDEQKTLEQGIPKLIEDTIGEIPALQPVKSKRK